MGDLSGLSLCRRLPALVSVALLALIVTLAACGGATPIPPISTATVAMNKSDANPTIAVEVLDPIRPTLPARRDLLYPASPRIQ